MEGLINEVFAALLGELENMLAEGLPEDAQEAADRLEAVAAPICEDAGCPEITRPLVLKFMTAAVASAQAVNAIVDLKEQGIEATPVGFIPGVGVVLEAQRPRQTAPADPGLN